MIELDGVVKRMVLCTPDLTERQLAAVAAIARADAIVSNAGMDAARLPGLAHYGLRDRPVSVRFNHAGGEVTEWVLLTSGTTGMPKLVGHTLQSLAGMLPGRRNGMGTNVWSTFYDIRRYGGLQIFLRAVLGGSTLVLSHPAESATEFLDRAAHAGVTHISGTPSHWRRSLMSGGSARFAPSYVRLSGEIADQPVLDRLREKYPLASVAHAFASTEAGVAFDIGDGRAGFPARLLDDGCNDPSKSVDLKVVGGTLRVRSSLNAARYLGEGQPPITASDGFVDTGDLVELVEDRYHFRGRIGGVINVGGLKVYPEEIEAILNADSRVRESLVRARRNPVTGAIVVADVVLTDSVAADDFVYVDRVKRELLGACRGILPPHKVPAMLRMVPKLEVTAAGKLVRPSA